MTPDVQVWISTARNKISYHELVPGGRFTVCGRYVGNHVEVEFSRSVEHGHVMSLAEVQDRFGSQPCRNCTGDKERVEPKVGRRWS